jgi:hypothetical protein
LQFWRFRWSNSVQQSDAVNAPVISKRVLPPQFSKACKGTWKADFLRQAVNDAVIDAALEMIDRYALRAYDAVQLAGCLVICGTVAEALTFVCSDHRLLEAARSEQLKVLDPTT